MELSERERNPDYFSRCSSVACSSVEGISGVVFNYSAKVVYHA